MKKCVLLTICLSIILCIVWEKTYASGFAFSSQEGVLLYYNYINDGKELEVTYDYFNSYNNYKALIDKSIIIPEEITYMSKTRKVTKVGNYAFLYSDIRSIILPSTIKTIGEYAFAECNRLHDLDIPDNVETIEKSALNGLRLRKLTIGKGVKKAGGYACSIDSIIIKDLKSFLEIDYGNTYNFFYKSSAKLYDEDYNPINRISIPDGVTRIGKSLQHSSSILSVTIPESVEEIDEKAFLECSKLKTVNLPTGLVTIGERAFEDCRSLHHIDLPNKLTEIKSDAFYRCRLDSIIIPNSVEYIGACAFAGCNLSSIIIPKNVKKIVSRAFSCDSLLSVTSEITDPEDILAGNAFNNNTLMNATLYIPRGTIPKYRSSEGWKDFVFIEEVQTNGMEKVESNKNKMEVYDLWGRKSTRLHKGINIEVMNDGSSRKIIGK